MPRQAVISHAIVSRHTMPGNPPRASMTFNLTQGATIHLQKLCDFGRKAYLLTMRSVESAPEPMCCGNTATACRHGEVLYW